VQHDYSLLVWREMEADVTNRVTFMLSLDGSLVRGKAQAGVTNSTSTVRTAATGIGLSRTSEKDHQQSVLAYCTDTLPGLATAEYQGYPGIGRHYLSWLERGNGTDTQTWQFFSAQGLIATIYQ